MTPYSTVLVLGRRGIIRPNFLLTVALRLHRTLGTLLYVWTLIYIRSIVNIVAVVPVVRLADIRTLLAILLIVRLVAIGLMTIHATDRSCRAR